MRRLRGGRRRYGNPIDSTAARSNTAVFFSAGVGAVDDGKTKKSKYIVLMKRVIVKTVVVMRIFSFSEVTLIFVTTKLRHSQTIKNVTCKLTRVN